MQLTGQRISLQELVPTAVLRRAFDFMLQRLNQIALMTLFMLKVLVENGIFILLELLQLLTVRNGLRLRRLLAKNDGRAVRLVIAHRI